MIDRGLRGPNSVRDAATISYLNEWLLRPRRDPYVDLRGMTRRAGRLLADSYCGSRPHRLSMAAQPVPALRWRQRPNRRRGHRLHVALLDGQILRRALPIDRRRM